MKGKKWLLSIGGTSMCCNTLIFSCHCFLESFHMESPCDSFCMRKKQKFQGPYFRYLLLLKTNPFSIYLTNDFIEMALTFSPSPTLHFCEVPCLFPWCPQTFTPWENSQGHTGCQCRADSLVSVIQRCPACSGVLQHDSPHWSCSSDITSICTKYGSLDADLWVLVDMWQLWWMFWGNNSRRTVAAAEPLNLCKIIQTMFLRLDLVNGIVMGLYFNTTSKNGFVRVDHFRKGSQPTL